MWKGRTKGTLCRQRVKDRPGVSGVGRRSGSVSSRVPRRDTGLQRDRTHHVPVGSGRTLGDNPGNSGQQGVWGVGRGVGTGCGTDHPRPQGESSTRHRPPAEGPVPPAGGGLPRRTPAGRPVPRTSRATCRTCPTPVGRPGPRAPGSGAPTRPYDGTTSDNPPPNPTPPPVGPPLGSLPRLEDPPPTGGVYRDRRRVP